MIRYKDMFPFLKYVFLFINKIEKVFSGGIGLPPKLAKGQFPWSFTPDQTKGWLCNHPLDSRARGETPSNPRLQTDLAHSLRQKLADKDERDQVSSACMRTLRGHSISQSHAQQCVIPAVPGVALREAWDSVSGSRFTTKRAYASVVIDSWPGLTPSLVSGPRKQLKAQDSKGLPLVAGLLRWCNHHLNAGLGWQPQYLPYKLSKIFLKIKKALSVSYLLIITIFITTSCPAVPFLNGTSSLVYQPVHQVFRKGDGAAVSGARGFVRLGGGFTILPDASALFDTFMTVSGPIDLRETGTLTLIANLVLGSNVTLSSGGKIDGHGESIILNGDLTLPTNKILHFISNTIIDGRGHTLTVGDYGQLFVDNSITLTLQNMVLKSGAKTSVFPPVRCAGQTSKLTLDNVMLEPGGDIPFYQGQLYVYNDVMFSGTSALVYASPQASFITSGATLAFDSATTFSFAPATPSNQQIILQDITSRILLDGCTLECTDTGMRLTKGTVLCDNKVALDSWSGLYFSSLTTVTSGIYINYGGAPVGGQRVSWSPDGSYLAMVGDGGVSTRIYKVYGGSGLLGTTFAVLPMLPGGVYPYAVAWSADRRYVAMGGATSGGAAGCYTIYSFNGATFTAGPNATETRYVQAAGWSPDGKYVAFGQQLSNGCKVFVFNGVVVKQVGSTISYTGHIWSIKWHPSGNYLALVGDSGVFVYSFNGATFTQVSSKVWSVKIYDIGWSPDGQYLAVGGETPNLVDGNILAADNIRIYSFNNATGALTAVIGRKYGTTVWGVGWHPDGKTLAVVGTGAASGGINNPFSNTNLVRIYQFTGTVLNGLLSYAPSSPLSGITTMFDCKWDPSGNYLGITGYDGSFNEYYGILKASFVPGPTPQIMNNTQAFANAVANPYSLVSTVTSGIYYKYGGNMKGAWNPNNGNYFAVAGQTGVAARVYKLIGDNGLLGTTFATLPLVGNTNPMTVAWSPTLVSTGLQYLAVAGGNGIANQGALSIYSFNGTSFNPSAVTSGTSYLFQVGSLAWSPDGKYLAVGFLTGYGCRVYSFNGTTLTLVGSTIAITGNPWGLTWCPIIYTPGGVTTYYFAIGADSGLFIYSLSGTTLTQTASRTFGGGTSSILGVGWSPNANYFAIGSVASTSVADGPILATDTIRVYTFNSTAGTLTALAGRYYGSGIYGLGWHPSDNKTFAVIGYGAASTGNNPFTDTNLLRFYKVNGTSVLDGVLSYALPSPLSTITYGWSCYWDPTGTYVNVTGQNGTYEYYGAVWAAPTSQTQNFTETTVFPGSDFSVTSALYGNPPVTDVTSFVNNLATQQGGSFAITARDEVITGTMSSYTSEAQSAGAPYFWNRGWPILSGTIGGAADTLWTKFHAVGSQDICVALANVGNINASTNLMNNGSCYFVDIGGPTNTSSAIFKGTQAAGYTAQHYHANPTQVLDGDNALITSQGGDYWVSYRPYNGELTWGKGTTVGLDPKLTYTDPSPLSGINRFGLYSSASANFTNVSIGGGMDGGSYTYKQAAFDGYFARGGWVLPGGTNDVKWIKFYAAGITDADICFTNRANINSSTYLVSSNPNAYVFLLRGWTNTQSAIGKGSQDYSPAYSLVTGYSTAGSLPGWFWASVQQNGTSSVTLAWGTGNVVGQNVAQTYTDASSPTLNLDRVALWSGPTAHPFSQIQVGSGADPGKQLILDFKNNAVATLGLNQTLALTAPASQAFSDSLVFGNAALGSSANNLKVKLLSGARVEIRGQVMDDSV